MSAIYHGWTETPERIAARWKRICERAEAFSAQKRAECDAAYMTLTGDMIAVSTNSGKVAAFLPPESETK